MVKEYKDFKNNKKQIFKNKEVIYKDESNRNHQLVKKKKKISIKQTDTN